MSAGDYNVPENPTAAKIVRTMRLINKPTTVKEISLKSKLAGQTVRNHLAVLVPENWVMISQYTATGGATYYQLVHGTGRAISVKYEDKFNTLSELLQKVVDKGYSKNPIQKNIELIIVGLFSMAANALNDDNPIPVRNTDLKALNNQGLITGQKIRELMALLDGIMGLSRLWDGNSLPKALIMEDPELDIEQVIDWIDRINQGFIE